MLMDVVASLREAGIAAVPTRPRARARPGLDGVVAVSADEVGAHFAVQAKGRAPYPNELDRLATTRADLAAYGEPLLVAPFVGEAVGARLRAAGWSWADTQGNFDLRAPGLVLSRRCTTTPPEPTGGRLPQGSGSLAIIRALVRDNLGAEEARATGLAAQAGVSQPRASQVLHRLDELDLVDRTAQGRWQPRRDALVDRFVAEYTGPRGSQRHLYSLDTPTDVAVRLARAATSGQWLAVSADVGPDLILGWRRPSVLVVYAQEELDTAALGLVEAQGRHDANVVIRYPDDASVFARPPLVAELRGVDIPLADPLQMLWDLHDLGGADRLEGAGLLHEWLLTHP